VSNRVVASYEYFAPIAAELNTLVFTGPPAM
jgi:hypothetical protein